jgi:hypothetical protein
MEDIFDGVYVLLFIYRRLYASALTRGVVQRTRAAQGHSSAIRTTRTPLRVRDPVQGTRSPVVPRASRGAEAARGGGEGASREARGRCAPPRLSPPAPIHTSLSLAESAKSEGARRRAEGANDAGRAAHFVLQRGTRPIADFLFASVRDFGRPE